VREREWHPSQVIEELPDGRIRLTLNVVIDWELQAWVMGFGPAAKVIQPVEFAKRIVDSLEQARATYLRTE
jgi:predicted DNA-binding transcriptional regulator YafY